MVVDHSLVLRGLASRWLSELPEIGDVTTHSRAESAMRAMSTQNPGIVILDLATTDTDGFSVLQSMRSAHPDVDVLVVAPRVADAESLAMMARQMGAKGIVTRPETVSNVESSRVFRASLTDCVQTLAQRRIKSGRGTGPAASPSPAAAPRTRPPAAHVPATARAARAPAPAPAMTRRATAAPKPAAGADLELKPFSRYKPSILVVGSSTGGPPALLDLVSLSNPVLNHVPVVIVQHMPDSFTALLAEHIARKSGRHCDRPEDGDVAVAGRVYVARGGCHLTMVKQGDKVVFKLNDGPPVNFCKPAVDPMFESAAEIFGASTLGVILTGMGQDGLDGTRAIVDRGGAVLAQDEASSVVWGMPGAVARAGLCAAVQPVPDIASTIVKLISGDRGR